MLWVIVSCFVVCVTIQDCFGFRFHSLCYFCILSCSVSIKVSWTLTTPRIGPHLIPTTSVTESPTNQEPSSVVSGGSRNLWTHGHGRIFWTEKDPGHRLGNIVAPRQSWRQRKLSGGGMSRQHGSMAARLGREAAPKLSRGGGTWGVWLSQVGDLSQLHVLTLERGGPGRHHVMP